MRALIVVLTLVLSLAEVSAGRQAAPATDRLGREILKELIETNTTHSTGNVTVAAERMAKRLVAAGFPAADVQVVGGVATKHNLVARYRGKGPRKPVLMIAHLDVVEA